MAKATSMAQLMAKAGNKQPFVLVKKGEILKGTITKLNSSEILVDINSKTEAVVLEKDKKILKTLLSHLHVGNNVTVQVLNPESDIGNPVVSLRRYIDDILWKELEEVQKIGKSLNATVSEITRGGFLVDIELGISGFLPNSQLMLASADAQKILGEKMQVYVLELNRANKKIIFSQKKMLTEEEFRKEVVGIKSGQKIDAIVTNVPAFGVFVNLPGKTIQVDGLIHVSEISWDLPVGGQLNQDLSKQFLPGQKLTCMVVGIDRKSKRVELSIKRLTEDPFEEIIEEFPLDKKIQGKIVKVDDAGVSVEMVENGKMVQGLIRKDKIPPGKSYEVGEEIQVTVAEIDKRRRRILLVPVLLRKTVGYR